MPKFHLKKLSFFSSIYLFCNNFAQVIKLNNDVVIEGNLLVKGTTEFNESVSSFHGVHIVSGTLNILNTVNINTGNSNSFTMTFGTLCPPTPPNTTIIFKNLPLVVDSTNLGFLTIDPVSNIVYVSHHVTPIPEDPFQVDTLHVDQIINNDDQILLINTQNQNAAVIPGETIIGTSNNLNITVGTGTILFESPITTSNNTLKFARTCICKESLTTNSITTDHLVLGNILAPTTALTLSITENMNLQTNNLIVKNNFLLNNQEANVLFQNYILNIGKNSYNAIISFSSMVLPSIPLTEIPENSMKYLALDMNTNSFIIATLPLEATVNAIITNEVNASRLNSTTTNETTVTSSQQITLDTATVALAGQIDSHLQEITILCPVTFEEDVFIGLSFDQEIASFISDQKTSEIDQQIIKKNKIQQRLKEMYKEMKEIIHE